MDTKRWIEKAIRIPLALIMALGLCLAPGLANEDAQAFPPPGVIIATFTVTAIVGPTLPPGSPFTDLPGPGGALPPVYLINGVCPDAVPVVPLCTLREAVGEANAIVKPAGSFAVVNFLPPPFPVPYQIDILYGTINVGSGVVIQGLPGLGPLIDVPNPPPAGLPFGPATVPPYDLFHMHGNNGEIHGLTIMGQGPGANASINDAIFIDGNMNLVDLNVIGLSAVSAVHIAGPSTTGNGTNNQVSQNQLGFDLSGACAPNLYGVHLDGGAANNIIGKSAAPYVGLSGNYISCNLNHGVFVDSLLGHPTIPPVSTTLIDSNAIGTDLAGLAARPNVKSGIYDYQGFTTIIKNNLISGNTLDGITLDGAQATRIMTQNLIGTDTNGAAALPNGVDGIKLVGGTGGASIGTDNVISGNLGKGISVLGAATIQNAFVGNYFGVDITGTIPIPNGGLPIDLGGDGHTPNDTGDTDIGPNQLLNYPVITGSTSTTISGTVCSGCDVQIYQAFGNPAATGGGGVYLARVTATGTSWTTTIPTGYLASDLTFVAYDTSNGDCSEMSPRMLLYLPMAIKP